MRTRQPAYAPTLAKAAIALEALLDAERVRVIREVQAARAFRLFLALARAAASFSSPQMMSM